MTKEEIQKLANACMFSFTEDELSDVEKSFQILYQQIEVLNKIDTENVEAMIYPFEEAITMLRSDSEPINLSKQDVLKNAMSKDEDYVKVKTKVVK